MMSISCLRQSTLIKDILQLFKSLSSSTYFCSSHNTFPPLKLLPSERHQSEFSLGQAWSSSELWCKYDFYKKTFKKQGEMLPFLPLMEEWLAVTVKKKKSFIKKKKNSSTSRQSLNFQKYTYNCKPIVCIKINSECVIKKETSSPVFSAAQMHNKKEAVCMRWVYPSVEGALTLGDRACLKRLFRSCMLGERGRGMMEALLLSPLRLCSLLTSLQRC